MFWSCFLMFLSNINIGCSARNSGLAFHTSVWDTDWRHSASTCRYWCLRAGSYLSTTSLSLLYRDFFICCFCQWLAGLLQLQGNTEYCQKICSHNAWQYHYCESLGGERTRKGGGGGGKGSCKPCKLSKMKQVCYQMSGSRPDVI